MVDGVAGAAFVVTGSGDAVVGGEAMVRAGVAATESAVVVGSLLPHATSVRVHTTPARPERSEGVHRAPW